MYELTHSKNTDDQNWATSDATVSIFIGAPHERPAS